MSVVDIGTRKPVVGDLPKGSTLVDALKRLVGRIEDGSVNVGAFYLLTDAGFSADNGLTANEAVMMLEREKFRVLCMLEGVKL